MRVKKMFHNIEGGLIQKVKERQEKRKWKKRTGIPALRTYLDYRTFGGYGGDQGGLRKSSLMGEGGGRRRDPIPRREGEEGSWRGRKVVEKGPYWFCVETRL